MNTPLIPKHDSLDPHGFLCDPKAGWKSIAPPFHYADPIPDMPGFQAAFERVSKAINKEMASAENTLTESQFIEAMRQALACGDFVKYCTAGESSVVDGRYIYEHRQAVSYEPFREVERLKARIRELELEIEQLRRDGSPLEE